VMARAVGLVGHALEELRQPLAVEVWHRTEAEASAAARGRPRGGKTPKSTGSPRRAG
jgi:hypothetical protein